MKRAPFLKRAFARFRSEERGSMAVEAVLILPMMFWTYLSIFSVFDAYRTYSINQKAAYTIADMISRETNAIDNDYLDGAREMFKYLTVSSNAETALRVTLVRYDEKKGIYKRDWSKNRGWVTNMSNKDVKKLDDDLPVMPDNDRVIVVETWQSYHPPFNTGLERREVYNFVFTKPRYAPQIVWDNGS